MFFKNKVGGTVGGLIFMIGLFILLYTLILPPCDKCELLGEDCSEVCKDKIYGEILLSENIGYVGEYSNSVDHNLDSADLFIKNEPSSSVLSNYLEIKHGLFGESDQVLEFSLDDMDNLNKLILSFYVIESKGDMIIELNNKVILNQNLIAGKIENVELPLNFLEENNKLMLRVSPPGFNFFSSNKYLLKDVILKENFELVHSSEVLDFSVNSSEFGALEDSSLSFYVYCKEDVESENILKIYLNENLLLNEVISCGDYFVDMDSSYFVKGVNELEFSISGGNYLIGDIIVSNSVSDVVYPAYEFYVSDRIYGLATNYYLSLDMSGNSKKAEIILNEEIIDLDSSNRFVEFDIKGMIKRGNNFIEVKPINDFEINELKIGYN